MRSTKAIISKSNIIYNLLEIKSNFPDKKIMALVKANAYGHGIIGVSRLLEENNIDFLGVAYINEAIMLRDAGIKSDIVVLVPELNDVKDYFNFNLQPAVSSIEYLKKLNDYGILNNQKVNVHLYIDTGMSRDGFMLNQIDELICSMKDFNNVIFNGICTHLSSSASDFEFSTIQIELFKQFINKFNESDIKFNYYHFANSGSISNLDISGFNLIRIGLSLYGYPPNNQNRIELSLKPVLSLETKIIMIRKLQKGDPVSYDRLFIAEDESFIATLPIGYGDGYTKQLTNKTNCIINGKLYPIVGAICMDECMVNLGKDKYEIGTKVTLIGKNQDLSISAKDLAEKINTIPYEITTAISSRVERIYL